VHFGVECLNASLKELRSTGELGNIDDREASLAKCFGRASRREQFDTVFIQSFSEVDQTGLIGNREQSALNSHNVLLVISLECGVTELPSAAIGSKPNVSR